MFKKFLLIIGLSSLVFGQDFPIYTSNPEETDLYVTVFNAISAIFFGSGETIYVKVLHLGVLIGTFVSFATFLLSGGSRPILAVLKYTITVAATIIILFGGTSRVIISSDNIPTLCASTNSNSVTVPVDNVPWSIGFSFSMVNRIGYALTDISKTLYSNLSPYTDQSGGFSMDKSGGFIGAIKQEISLLSLSGIEQTAYNKSLYPEIKADSNLPKAFFSECIFIPFSSKGWSGLNEINRLKNSKNIFQDLDRLFRDPDAGGNPNISIGGIHPRDFRINNGGEVFKCGDVYDKQLEPLALAYKDTFFCSFPKANYAALQLITGAATPPASNLSDIALQAALIGTMKESSEQLGTGIENAGYIIENSKIEFSQQEISKGLFQSSILPDIKSTLSILLISMFPFVLLTAFFMGKFKILGEFTKAIIWIELWLPISSILNMLILSALASRNASNYVDNGVNSLNVLDFMSDATFIAGTAGYLYSMVPALAWLIVNGTADMLGTVGSGMTSALAVNMQSSEFNKDQKIRDFSEKSGGSTVSSTTEALQMNAIKQGKVSGRTLSAENTMDISSVGDAKAMATIKSTTSVAVAKEITGSGAEATGHGTGTISGINTGGQALAGDNFSGPDGDVSDTAKKAAKFDSQAISGDIDSKAHNQDYMTRDDQKLNKDYQINSDKTKAIAQKTLGRGYVDSQANTDIQKQAQNKEYQKQNGGTAQGAINRGKALGNKNHYKDSVGIKEVSDLQGAGITPEMVGSAQATNIAEQVGQAEATKKMAKEVNKKEGEGFKKEEISKRSIPKNESKEDYKKRLKREKEEIKQAGIDYSNSFSELGGVVNTTENMTLARGVSTVETTAGVNSIVGRSFKKDANGNIMNVNTNIHVGGVNANADAYMNKMVYSDYQHPLADPAKMLYGTLQAFNSDKINDFLLLDNMNYNTSHTMHGKEVEQIVMNNALLDSSLNKVGYAFAAAGAVGLALKKYLKHREARKLKDLDGHVKDIHSDIDTKKTDINKKIDDLKTKQLDLKGKIENTNLVLERNKADLKMLEHRATTIDKLLKSGSYSWTESIEASKELRDIEEKIKIEKSSYFKENKTYIKGNRLDSKDLKSMYQESSLLKSDLKNIENLENSINSITKDSKKNGFKVTKDNILKPVDLFNSNQKVTTIDNIGASLNSSIKDVGTIKGSLMKAPGAIIKGGGTLVGGVAAAELVSSIAKNSLRDTNTAFGISAAETLQATEDVVGDLFGIAIDTVQGVYDLATNDYTSFDHNMQEIRGEVQSIGSTIGDTIDTIGYEFSHERQNQATTTKDWLASGQKGAAQTAQSIYNWVSDNIDIDNSISSSSYEKSQELLEKNREKFNL